MDSSALSATVQYLHYSQMNHLSPTIVTTGHRLSFLPQQKGHGTSNPRAHVRLLVFPSPSVPGLDLGQNKYVIIAFKH